MDFKKETIKPGVKTTEFWLTLMMLVGAVIVPAIVTASNGNSAATWAISIAGVVGVLGFAFLRLWHKAELAGTVDFLSTEQENRLVRFLELGDTILKAYTPEQKAKLFASGITPEKILEIMSPVNDLLDVQANGDKEPVKDVK